MRNILRQGAATLKSPAAIKPRTGSFENLWKKPTASFTPSPWLDHCESKTAAIYCQHVQIVALHVQQAIRLNRLKCTVYFISSNHSCESSCSQVTISGTSRWIYKWQVKALQWNCMQDFNIQQKVIGHVCVCVLCTSLLFCWPSTINQNCFQFLPEDIQSIQGIKVRKLDILIQDLGLQFGVHLGSSRNNSHFPGAHHIKGSQDVSQDQPQGFRTHRHLQLFRASGFMSFWSVLLIVLWAFSPFHCEEIGATWRTIWSVKWESVESFNYQSSWYLFDFLIISLTKYDM